MLEIARATRCGRKGTPCDSGRRDAVREKERVEGLKGGRRRDKMTVCKRSRGSGREPALRGQGCTRLKREDTNRERTAPREMRSRRSESREERSERQCEHRRERSCQGERAVLESEWHHEYERDVLGGESAPGVEAKREGTDGGE